MNETRNLSVEVTSSGSPENSSKLPIVLEVLFLLGLIVALACWPG